MFAASSLEYLLELILYLVETFNHVLSSHFLQLSRKIDIVINQPYDTVCLTTALQIDGIRDNTLVKCQYFIYSICPNSEVQRTRVALKTEREQLTTLLSSSFVLQRMRDHAHKNTLKKKDTRINFGLISISAVQALTQKYCFPLIYQTSYKG